MICANPRHLREIFSRGSRRFSQKNIFMKFILFVCIENSNRSQLAEAFANIHSKGKVNAFSAGSRPSGKIHPRAIAAMKKRGYDLSKHRSKSLEEIINSPLPGRGAGGEAFECVVTMGCGDECPFIVAKHRHDWDLPDPKDLNEREYEEVVDVIEERVKNLLEKIN